MIVERTCETCGKTFLRGLAHIKQNGGKYCSRRCFDKRKQPSSKIKKVCVRCGTEFYIYPSEEARGWGKFCSHDCEKQARIRRICDRCGKEFFVTEWYLAKGWGKYCSKSCAAGSPSLELHCAVCGSPFRAQVNRIAKGLCQYCSPECFYKANTGTGNARWLGGISFEPYCPKFNNELKESIREKYDRTCQLCGEKENGKKLAIHHINFDKKAGCFGKPWNLIPLDAKCHSWTTNHRFESFQLLMNHWAMNPDINLRGDNNYIY